MNKCAKCSRPLLDDEKKLCPACLSSKKYKRKKFAEIVGGVVGVFFVIKKVITRFRA